MKYLFIVLLIAMPLHAAIWHPSASLSASWEGNYYSTAETGDSVLSSVSASAEMDIITMKIGSYGISLPLFITYSSHSSPSGRVQKLPYLEGGGGIGGFYHSSHGIEAGGHALIAIRWIEGTDAAEWVMGGMLYAAFALLPYASLFLPITMLGGKNGFTFRLGAGIRIQLRSAV